MIHNDKIPKARDNKDWEHSIEMKLVAMKVQMEDGVLYCGNIAVNGNEISSWKRTSTNFTIQQKEGVVIFHKSVLTWVDENIMVNREHVHH